MKVIFRRIYTFGILLLILICTVFIIQYSYMNNKIIENKEHSIEQSRQLLGQRINSELNLYSQVIESTAKLIMTNNWEQEEIKGNLKHIYSDNPVFNLLYYVGPYEKTINVVEWDAPSAADMKARPWYLKAVEKEGLIYSDTYVDLYTGGLIITIAKPIYDTNNQIMGVVGGDILINDIVEIVENSSQRAGDMGYSFLIDSAGNILAHPDYMYNKYSDLKNIAKISDTLLEDIKQNDYGQKRITLEDVDGYLSYQPIENTDWIIGNFASLKEYRQIDSYVLKLLLMALPITLMALGAFFILQNKYFIRPLKGLIKDIESVAIEENIAYRLPVSEKDPFIEPRNSINMILEKTQVFFTKQEAYHQEVDHLSYYDYLTGIYNRRYFETKIRKMDSQENLPLGIIMIDVNGLKLVNDSFGYEVGDELLKETGRVLGKGCHGRCPVFRMGGDEFVIILPQTSPEEIEGLIKTIRDLSKTINLHNIELFLSFGVAIKNNQLETIAEILKEAEDDMNSNKLLEGPSMRSRTIDMIVQTLYEKSPREEAHSTRVSSICQQMGIELGLRDEKIKQLETVGMLHDIGKIAISNHILEKPGALSSREWEEVKRHPEIGYRILSTTSEMAQIAEYVLAHHERYDGKGYPRGLKGKQIPLVSRIIIIADTYDAMISDRPYRKGLDEEIAIKEIIKHSGTQFDPDLARLFIEKVLDKEWKEQ